MPNTDIDFEGSVIQGNNSDSVTNPANNDNTVVNQEDVTSLNGNDTDDITGKDNNTSNTNNTNKQDTTDDNTSTGELNVGDSLEVEGKVYTVSENGDIIDEKGNVFKEAKDVKEWLQSVEVEEDSDTISVDSIQKALGVTITDNKGQPVEFTNDANGVKSYVDAVIELRSNELQEAAINSLYNSNPLLKQFQDYVQLTGSPKGFAEIPDRSGIVLDKNNEAQLISVIKMAATEFGNKSMNDSYINYLKDSGNLYSEAKTMLDALVEKDIEYRQEIEQRAKEQRDEEARNVAEYWNTVNKLVSNRVIGGYKIPESFTKEVDGKKIIVTPNDFFNYLSVPKQVDNTKPMTGYQRDLAKLTDEEYLNREILDAWLMFTGGTYKDLIDMAVKEEKVRQLRVKSKEQRSTKAVKVIKNTSTKSSINDIVF